MSDDVIGIIIFVIIIHSILGWSFYLFLRNDAEIKNPRKKLIIYLICGIGAPMTDVFIKVKNKIYPIIIKWANDD